MIKFVCNKLSRDKTVESMNHEGIVTHYKLLNNTELQDALKAKLIEEAHEVQEAVERNDIISEIADVLELIDGLYKAYEISPQEVAAAQKAAHQRRGGYEKGIFMQTIEMDVSNPRVAHFRKSPTRYPEVE